MPFKLGQLTPGPCWVVAAIVTAAAFLVTGCGMDMEREHDLSAGVAPDPGVESTAAPAVVDAGEDDEPRALPHAWMRRVEPPPTPFTIMPVADSTGLRATMNFELREMSRRLIPAWMAVAGEAPEVLDTWVFYPWLSRDVPGEFMRTTVRPREELLALGQRIRTDAILQVEMTREGRDTIANAWLLDVGTGERTAGWSAAVDYRANIYEPIFDAQAKLAPIAAAELAGISTEELLAVPDISERLGPDERAEVEAAVAGAADILHPPTYPRLFEAMYIVLDALEKDPKNPELWTLYTIIQTLMLSRLEDYETEDRREAVIRAIIGGEIAIALAPDDPRVRYAYGMSLRSSGRRTVALNLARQNHEAHPDSWLDHLQYQVLHWEDDAELGIPATLDDPIERLIRDLEYGYARTRRGDGTVAEILASWLSEDPFAPHLVTAWANHPRASGVGLDRSLLSAHLMAAQGSMLTIMESARQLSRHGRGDDARAMLSRIYDITGADMPEGTGPELFRATREHLSEWFDTQAAGDFARRPAGLPEGSPLWELLLASRDCRHRVVEILGQDVGRPGPLGRTVSYTPWQAMEIANRIAVDGALSVYGFYRHRYGAPATARNILFRLEEQFPHDLGVLVELLEHHRYHQFDASKVNYTRDRIMDIAPVNMRLQRTATSWQFGADADVLHRLERLKYWEPFHLPTIRFVVNALARRDFYDKAHEYAILQRFRDPADYIGHYREALYGAWKEGRRIEKEEIASIEQYINPHNERRDAILARYFETHGYIEEAIERWERLLHVARFLGITDTRRLADLYQKLGEPEKSVILLNHYAENASTLQTGTTAIMDIHALYLRQGDLEKAGEYLRAVQRRDPGMGRAMSQWQVWNLYEGNTSRAEGSYLGAIDRYPFASQHLNYALFLHAEGRNEEAWDQIEAAFEMAPNDFETLRYQTLFMIRDGRVAEAERILKRRAQWYDQDAGSPSLLAEFHMWTGDYDKAMEYGPEMLQKAREGWRTRVRRILANIHLRRGELDEAAEHINHVLMQNASNMTFQTYEAEVLLRRGLLDEAEEAMRHAYNYRTDRANAIMGDILHERGRLEEALEHKRAANRFQLPYPEVRWLYEEGRIAEELGRDDEAREVWERVVDLFGGEHHEFGRLALEGLERLDAR